jgi:hypothetical protein
MWFTLDDLEIGDDIVIDTTWYNWYVGEAKVIRKITSTVQPFPIEVSVYYEPNQNKEINYWISLKEIKEINKYTELDFKFIKL